MALRMRFVTSQCTVRGIGLVGEGTLDNMEGSCDHNPKIQHQFDKITTFSPNCLFFAITATPHHRS